eukprot:gene22666-7810_t
MYRATVRCAHAAAVVDVSAAATPRGGLWRIAFPSGAPRRVRVRLTSPLDRLVGGEVARDGGSALRATRRSAKTHHCSADHTTYWWAEADAAIESLTSCGDEPHLWCEGFPPNCLPDVRGDGPVIDTISYYELCEGYGEEGDRGL